MEFKTVFTNSESKSFVLFKSFIVFVFKSNYNTVLIKIVNVSFKLKNSKIIEQFVGLLNDNTINLCSNISKVLI